MTLPSSAMEPKCAAAERMLAPAPACSQKLRRNAVVVPGVVNRSRSSVGLRCLPTSARALAPKSPSACSPTSSTKLLSCAGVMESVMVLRPPAPKEVLRRSSTSLPRVSTRSRIITGDRCSASSLRAGAPSSTTSRWITRPSRSAPSFFKIAGVRSSESCLIAMPLRSPESFFRIAGVRSSASCLIAVPPRSVASFSKIAGVRSSAS